MSEKTLNTSESNPATKAVPDIQKYGNVDQWKLLAKASSQIEGWMKSTKVLELKPKQGRPGGCLIQVTTQQRNPDGSYSLAEAITFVPGVRHNDFHFPKA